MIFLFYQGSGSGMPPKMDSHRYVTSTGSEGKSTYLLMAMSPVPYCTVLYCTRIVHTIAATEDVAWIKWCKTEVVYRGGNGWESSREGKGYFAISWKWSFIPALRRCVNETIWTLWRGFLLWAWAKCGGWAGDAYKIFIYSTVYTRTYQYGAVLHYSRNGFVQLWMRLLGIGDWKEDKLATISRANELGVNGLKNAVRRFNIP